MIARFVRRWRAGLFLLATAFAASCNSRDDDIARYIAARGAHQRLSDSLWAKHSMDSALNANDAFVDAYRPLLRRIVGSLEMDGLSDSVDVHIGTQGVYDNDALPDGFLYRTTDSVAVFVTDTALFNAWGAQVLNNRSGVSALLSQDFIWGVVFAIGAGSYDCGEIPGVRGAMQAKLIEYSQDKMPGCNPDRIVVTVIDGRRLYAAQRKMPDSVRSDARRVTALAQSIVDRLPGRRQRE